MQQPAGRVCGFPVSMGSYLRSSPIICVADAALIILWFTFYCYNGDAPAVAAKKLLVARDAESPRQFLDKRPIPSLVRSILIAIGLLS